MGRQQQGNEGTSGDRRTLPTESARDTAGQGTARSGGSLIEVTVWCKEVCGTTRGEKSACSNKCLPGVAVETGSSSGRVFSTVFMAS